MITQNTEQYVKGYIRGYANGWKDLQALACQDLWEIHNRVANLDPDLGKLLEEAISRIEKRK